MGGIGKNFLPGTLALVRDHMNFTGKDPFADIPPEDRSEERSPMFPDMSDVYPAPLRKAVQDAAKRLQIPLREGVLAVTHGPSYETPAEVRRLKKAGADAVCMSGLCESAFAAFLGLPVLFLIVAANRAAGLSDKKLSHDDVVARVKESEESLSRLFEEALPALVSAVSQGE